MLTFNFRWNKCIQLIEFLEVASCVISAKTRGGGGKVEANFQKSSEIDSEK